MTGIHQTARKRGAAAGVMDTTAMSADDVVGSGTAFAQATFYADGSVGLNGNDSTSPASPRWWSDNAPPSAWLEFTSTGTGTIINGLSPGTRYSVPTLIIGISRGTVGVSSRTFTMSFYDAASGGNLLGTKTFTATAVRA